jgi:hypothetical protein
MTMGEFWDTENLDALSGLNNGDVEGVIRLLVGNYPIHREVRLLLADILDNSAGSEWYHRVTHRRKSRPKLGSGLSKLDSKDPTFLINLLRKDPPLPAAFKSTLAEMLNPIGDSEWHFKRSRRRPGKPGQTLTRDMRAGQLVAEYFESYGPGTFEAAVTTVCKEMNMIRSSAINAYSLHKWIKNRLDEEEE